MTRPRTLAVERRHGAVVLVLHGIDGDSQEIAVFHGEHGAALWVEAHNRGLEVAREQGRQGL